MCGKKCKTITTLAFPKRSKLWPLKKKRRERERRKEGRNRKKERKGTKERRKGGKGKGRRKVLFLVPSKEENQVWILRLPLISPAVLSKMCTPLPTL